MAQVIRDHTMELIAPCVPSGVEDGYVTYRASNYAAFGCSCGVFVEGKDSEVRAKANAHRDEVKNNG